MKLQFDANQEFQLQAIQATVDLFAAGVRESILRPLEQPA